jgi:hypothetical protein
LSDAPPAPASRTRAEGVGASSIHNAREQAEVEPINKQPFPQPRKETAVKDFSNASFTPDMIRAMDEAFQGAVATLPDPVSSRRVQSIAESILRCAKEGERDPRTLQTMALVEMQIRSDEK